MKGGRSNGVGKESPKSGGRWPSSSTRGARASITIVRSQINTKNRYDKVLIAPLASYETSLSEADGWDWLFVGGLESGEGEGEREDGWRRD
jgi:hypothetical protein